MQWPSEWRDPAKLALLESTPINFLVVEPGDEFAAVRTAAKARGIGAGDKASLPEGVKVLKGDWPGVRLSQSGEDTASAGPTGEPWVNTNGWRVAIESALAPGTISWVSAPPRANAVLTAASIRMAVADSAVAGGRWILALNDSLAAAVAQGNAAAVEVWKEGAAAVAFFSRQADWATWKPRGTIGVVSDFAGKNGALTREVVNLIGRAASHYTIIPKNSASSTFEGLRAVVYADLEPPDTALRQRILEFVNKGGTLITTPDWGKPEGASKPSARPGYGSFSHGKGRIELAAERSYDPYTLANDAVVIVSHRYDLARLWNGGAHGSYSKLSPDGKRMLAQFLIYSDQPATEATAWVAGQYRSAKLYTIGKSPQAIDLTAKAGGAEMQLPPIGQYAAIELERV
jgi:hypothetical protein